MAKEKPDEDYMNQDLDRLEFEESSGPVEGEYVPGPESFESEQAKPAFDPEIKNLVGGLLMMGAGFVASRRGEHWNMTPDEVEVISTNAAVLIEEYLPGTTGGPVLGLALSVFAYAAPRVGMDAARAAQEKSEAKPEKDIGGGDGGGDWGESAAPADA